VNPVHLLKPYFFKTGLNILSHAYSSQLAPIFEILLPLVRKRTIQTEQQPLVGEIQCQLLWTEGSGVVSAADPPTIINLSFLDRPYLIISKQNLVCTSLLLHACYKPSYLFLQLTAHIFARVSKKRSTARHYVENVELLGSPTSSRPICDSISDLDKWDTLFLLEINTETSPSRLQRLKFEIEIRP
jgi:hypothetical protein